MPEQYYLYQHQFKVEHGQQILALELPPAEDVYDENYGHTQVYYQQVSFKIPTQAAQRYQVSWQGCAQDRLCYPPQRIEFQTRQHWFGDFRQSKRSTKKSVGWTQ